MFKRIAFLLLMLLALGGMAQAQRTPQELYEGQFQPPEFPAGLDWINVENPLTLNGLRGKIVILDFWTYGCVNCLHVIPVLEQVEQKFADEVVVIGVHSAKFENEGQTENLRQIVQRYGLHHPVVNDHEFEIWRSFGANAWPTMVIVDPRGYGVIRQSGEIPFSAFDNFLTGMVAYYDGLDAGVIDRTPLALALEGAGDPGTPLLYPGKVLADETNERLFIADSSHNRIIVVDLESREVVDIIGSSARGFVDGGFDEAAFDKPQGMALDGNWLYIADVNNHAIRAADLAARDVITIAGNGDMGRSRLEFGMVAENPLGISLRSPWDVELDDRGRLHIAMAGAHQLYIYEPETNLLYPSVGNGREANLNGVSLANAELAQPSGLYYAGGGKLYFADSESSTIRLADFEQDLVSVASGTTANNLFDFGDVDGELGENLLQHALGVEGGPGGEIYIADTYNSRIKVIAAGESGTETLFGHGGAGGYADGAADVAQFDEPGGLSYADGILYVADTNNHVIRTIDLAASIVGTFAFSNPEALVIDADAVTLVGGNTADRSIVMAGPHQVAPGDAALSLRFSLPPDFKINPLIESEVLVAWGEPMQQVAIALTSTDISIPLALGDEDTFVNADVTLYYCREGEEGLCFIETFAYAITVEVSSAHEQTEITLEREIVPPEL